MYSVNKTALVRKSVLIGLFLLMTLYHAISIFSIHGVNCSSDWLTPNLPCDWFFAILEMSVWGYILFLFILELVWAHDFKTLLKAGKSVWPVFLFVTLAGLSSLWSIEYRITLYQAAVLLMTTLLAVYTGAVLGTKRLLDMLVWFFAALCIMNFGSLLLFPQRSLMPEYFYHRAWNGIFWHRNYLGCFMALGIPVFLLKLLDWKNIGLGYKLVCPSMMVAGVFLLVKTDSATGILTAAVLAGVCLVMAAWLRWGKHLKRVHYYLLLGVFLAALALILFKLDYIFGLLGRNTSLTGRIPMWQYLFENIVMKRPVLGYGCGVVWSLQGFREGLRDILGWAYPVMIGDNGFVDITLHLGFLGMAILVGLIVLGFVRAVRHFLKVRTLASALPVVLLVFTLVANIALSLILESESFVWAMTVASQAAIGVAKNQDPDYL